MKQRFFSIVVLLAAGFTQVQASEGKNENDPAKKSSTVVVQNILSDRLPARLLTPIKKTYKDYWITDLNKRTNNGKVSYCITVENADKKITMSATPASSWSVTRVTLKDAL